MARRRAGSQPREDSEWAPERERELRSAVTSLLNWFSANARDLPWRKRTDPYHILVSEFLLQQTTVPVAVRYYEAFLSAFPTLEVLAQASLDEVLRVWAGAGYYARARNLRETAIRILKEHGGRVPADPEELIKLPGIGTYTANAIASLAFGVNVVALDANGVKVLSRLAGRKGMPRRGSFRRRLQEIAERVCPKGRAREFNQALMDLGSLVCTAENPRCGDCPVRRWCAAYRSGQPEEYPIRTEPTVREALYEVACVIFRDGLFLVGQRAPGRWWGHLWEFPRDRIGQGESSLLAAERLARERLSLSVRTRGLVASLRHSVTRYRIYLSAVLAEYQSGEPRSDTYVTFRWLPLSGLRDLPSSSPQRRIVQVLADVTQKGDQESLLAQIIEGSEGRMV